MKRFFCEYSQNPRYLTKPNICISGSLGCKVSTVNPIKVIRKKQRLINILNRYTERANGTPRRTLVSSARYT